MEIIFRNNSTTKKNKGKTIKNKIKRLLAYDVLQNTANMKKILFITLTLPLVCICACSNDDDLEKQQTETVVKRITSVDYSDSYLKNKDMMAYDEMGRIIHFERNDSDNSFAHSREGDGVLLERSISTDYTYDLENNKIYIKTMYHYPAFRRSIYDEATTVDKYGYDTLFIKDNKVEAIHRYTEGLLSDNNMFKSAYFISYNNEGQMTKMGYSYRTTKQADANEYEIGWENGNLVSISAYGKVDKDVFPFQFKYNSDKGVFPIYNTFTLLFSPTIGLLAADGWFGITPVNMLSDYCIEPEGTESNEKSWSHITYEWGEDNIQKCHIMEYKWNTCNMIVRWE